MSHLTVGDYELFHQRHGAGTEPLLLIQGMSGTHLSWGEPFLAELDRDFETISYDHRGIGFSPLTTEAFTIAELADDALGLLDRLEVETAHVLGISMGGMVAQELALRHGSRIRTLALGCTYCGGPGSALAGPEVAELLFEGMRSGDRELALRNGFTVNVSQAFAADPANFAPFREMALAAPARVQTIMLQLQAISAHDTQSRLASIDRPTLVIHGTEDRMLPPVNGELIASLIPGARLELLEGVGHMWWWEQPRRGAQLVRDHALAARPAQ
jgi:pimeloyl-ACP methyl ester carboxylesterase